MKASVRNYIFAALLAATASGVRAQDMNSAYFLDGFSYRHDMNPAYGNDRSYFGIPLLGNFNVQLRGSLGVGDLLFKNPYYGDSRYPNAKKTATFMHPGISVNEALSGLEQGANTLLFNMDLPILSIGFGAFNGYNTIELRERSHVGLSLPYEFFEFAKDLKNKEYTFDDMGMRGWSYIELGFGHSRQLFDNLRVGAKVKLLFGVAYADVSMSDVRAKLDGDQWIIDGKARAELYMKGASFTEKEDAYKTRPSNYRYIDNIDVDGFSPMNGFGLGFDLGGIYEFKDCPLEWLDGLKASLALTDLGFINYGNGIVAESSGQPFEFSGFNNMAVRDRSETDTDKSPSSQADDYSDRLRDFANLQKKDEGLSASHGLGATLRMGLEYPLPVYDKLKFGFLYTHRYAEQYGWSEGRLSANYSPLRWLNGGINLAFSSFSTEMGWVLNIHSSGCNLFMGMDYMMGKTGKSMIPLDSNVCFNFGVNITWGSKKDNRTLKRLGWCKETPEPVEPTKSAQPEQQEQTGQP